MPRKVSKNTTQPAAHQRTYADTVRVERLGFMQQVRAIVQDQRSATVCGIVLLFLALFAGIAYLSFFITGAADANVVEMARPERLLHRAEIRNVLGLSGARLSSFLVDGTFGLMSLGFVLLLLFYGLRLTGIMKRWGWKAFFCTAFWMVWGSILLAFLQTQLHIDLFFRLGGAHGAWLNTWLTSFVQPLGTVLILLAIVAVFLVISDAHFVEHICALWARFTALFHKKAQTPDGADATADGTPATDGTTVLEPVIINVPDPEPTSSVDTVIQVEPVVPEQPETLDSPAIRTDSVSGDSPAVRTDSVSGDSPAPDFTIHETKVEELGEQDPEALLRAQGPYDPRKDLEHYKFPTLDLLKVYDNETAPVIDQAEQQANANKIVTTLRNFGIEIEQIKATVGPTVTLYEVVPKAGTRIAKIQALEQDIMLSLSAIGIRIIAPMPGKGTIGIEVPNEKKQTVSMHSVIASKRFQEDKKMRLPIAMGKTITNEVFMFDLAKTPHLLVAGATGQGKSVAINAIITSLLYKKHPSELKLVLVDPKRVEFVPYRALVRHYLAAMPGVDERDIIITDCQKVIDTLNSLVIEMENRYELLEDAGVRNLEDYNDKFINRRLNPDKLVAGKFHHQFLPYIVIIIDEYGDFIMQAGKQVETPIARITQKARAVGMHMILATQRPSVNIVTGVIKANIPTRIALRTQSVVDSRTVLDAKGADQLIGKGDMLYSGGGETTRIQCAFVDTPEVDQIVEHVSQQQHFFEPYQLPEYVPEGQEGDAPQPGAVDMKRLDPMFADVARYVVNKQEGSTSRLQRAFEIGYNRAGKLSDQLEAAGIVGPNKGPKGRDVLIQDPNQLEELLATLSC